MPTATWTGKGSGDPAGESSNVAAAIGSTTEHRRGPASSCRRAARRDPARQRPGSSRVRARGGRRSDDHGSGAGPEPTGRGGSGSLPGTSGQAVVPGTEQQAHAGRSLGAARLFRAAAGADLRHSASDATRARRASQGAKAAQARPRPAPAPDADPDDSAHLRPRVAGTGRSSGGVYRCRERREVG